jgi:esterase FrsA
VVQQSNRVRELAAWKIEEDRMNFFNNLNQSGASLLCFVLAATLAGSAFAQEHRERTLEEIKVEATKRAENGMYPLIGLDPVDVREAFTSIKTLDNDEWAAGFSAVADRYAAQAKTLEATDPAKASTLYVKAWRLYSFGRWPTPASPGKQRAYMQS